jgi:hypothetical protein
MVTGVPTGPELGENPPMEGVGEDVTVKAVELVAVPPGVATEIGPVAAPDGTVAVICTPDTTVKFPDPTLVPLNFTSVAPVKPEPLMVTDVPTGPEGGVKSVMAGWGGSVAAKSIKSCGADPAAPSLVE